jgi:hypothetical protein
VKFEGPKDRRRVAVYTHEATAESLESPPLDRRRQDR